MEKLQCIKLVSLAWRLCEKILKENVEVLKNSDAIITIMCGHFTAATDSKDNKVYPGIEGLYPEHLFDYIEDLGMVQHPLISFELGVVMMVLLRERGYKVKLCILANDIMGISELSKHSCNDHDKKDNIHYEQELLAPFSELQLPDIYRDLLNSYSCSVKDLLIDTYEMQSSDGRKSLQHTYAFSEKRLLKQFQKLVRENKNVFEGKIGYNAKNLRNVNVDSRLVTEDPSSYDIALNVLGTAHLKSCSFQSDDRKVTVETGGNKCSVEITSLALGTYGGNGFLDQCTYIPNYYKQYTISSGGVLFLLVPYSCDDAVIRGCNLYNNFFQSGKGVRVSSFPLYKNALETL